MAKQYKTKRLGKDIDLDALKSKFGSTVAVGNMNVNARGDVLGKGGKIVEKASDRTKKDYSYSEKSIKRVNIKKQLDDDKKKNEEQEAERKRDLVNKEAKLRKELAAKDETDTASASKTTKKKKSNSKKNNDDSKSSTNDLKPTKDPNVFEKVEENGDIILVNEQGNPIPTPETLDDPDGGLDNE